MTKSRPFEEAMEGSGVEESEDEADMIDLISPVMTYEDGGGE